MGQDKLPQQDETGVGGRYWNGRYSGLEVSISLGAKPLYEERRLVAYSDGGAEVVAIFIPGIRHRIAEVVNETLQLP